MAGSVAPERMLSRAQRELRDRILEELTESDGWGGIARATQNVRTGADASERDYVHGQGVAHGCHECGTSLATDVDQPWIGDHIPPWGLKDSVRTHFGLADHEDTWLVPSCQTCSTDQAAYVASLNATAPSALPAVGTLSARQREMLGVGDRWRDFQPTRATSGGVLPGQGEHVQTAGIAVGCHICGARVPCTRYIADHYPPTTLNTPVMLRLYKHLDIDFPAGAVLKPHCPKCSTAQGARLAMIARDALAMLSDLGINSARNPAVPAKFRDFPDYSATVGRSRARSKSPKEKRDRSRSRDYDRRKKGGGDDDLWD
ncbi:MAG: hypothetical protein JO180_00815 [Gemmatirosa sp.]|nr:hypothetical protein [Gemmatirosa sp.]